jgi:hypothetical protein
LILLGAIFSAHLMLLADEITCKQMQRWPYGQKVP